MTIIVGITEKGKTWLGSDTRIAAGSGIAGTYPKVYIHNPILGYGVCGMLRDLNIIQNIFIPPPPPNVKSTKGGMAYLVSSFIPALITALDDNQRLKEEDEDFGGCVSWQGHMLIALGTRLYELQPDFAVFEVLKYGAIGSGADYAKGILESSQLSPPSRCRLAIKTASKFDSGCNDKAIIHQLQ